MANGTQTAEQEEVTAVPPLSSIIKKSNHPVILKFADVVYKLKTKKGGSIRGEHKLDDDEKVILNGITGAVLPGEMLAILGPSGSGKTTLLTALGGRLFGGQLDGTISYNGNPFSSAMNRNTGFVSQDDKFYPHLTVTETMIFTALLRLPKTLTKEEKIIRAEAVISQLGLTRCKNTIMGGALLRGVSGGERKRVSIGQEMLMNPSLFFLDEPTTGLDSTSAQQVVSMLRELADKGGRTVLMSIHQPSSKLFYLFHKVLLLSEGYPLYFGNGGETMDYFSSIGYTPSVAVNPSDFLLDLANGFYLDDSDVERGNAIKQAIVYAYKNNLANRLKEELLVQEIGNNQLTRDRQITDKHFGKWSTTWGQQFFVLLKRDLKERRHESFSCLRTSQVLITSFLCGLIWWQSSIHHLDDQIGLLFFTCIYWGLIPLIDAIFIFPQERMMLIKERSSRMYKLSSYFLARTLADLPMELALPTIFVTIIYWMGGLKPTVGHFLKSLFIILSSVMVSQSLGLAIGASIMKLRSGTILAAVISQTFFLVSGFYVEHIPGFVSWIKYLSANYYTYKLLLGSQYKAEDLYTCGPNISCRIGSNPAIKNVGLGNEAISFVALGVMLVGYRVIAYVALTRLQ